MAAISTRILLWSRKPNSDRYGVPLSSYDNKPLDPLFQSRIGKVKAKLGFYLYNHQALEGPLGSSIPTKADT